MTVDELIAALAKHPGTAQAIVGWDPLSVEGPIAGHAIGGCYEDTPGIGGLRSECVGPEHDHAAYGVVISPGRLDDRVAHPHTVRYWLESRAVTDPGTPPGPWIRMAANTDSRKVIVASRDTMAGIDPHAEYRVVRVDTLYTVEDSYGSDG